MKKILFVIISAVLFLNATASNKVTVSVKNAISLQRSNEIVEINLKKVTDKLGLKDGETFVVKDAKAKQISYQIASNNGLKNAVIIFPASVKSKGICTYTIQKGTPAKFESKVYGRLVPERKDDYCWENDRIAFRVYGPALQATGEVSSGIDVWAKRTDKLIINKWYADEEAGKQSYHEDHGEGLDMYKVGPTLGAGATTPYVDGKLYFSKNFVKSEVLDNGPLRMTVKLIYAPFIAEKTEITETRIISLDAGSQLNKVTIIYNANNKSIPAVTGIVMRNSKEEKTFTAENKNYFLHAEPKDSINGTLYEAVIVTKPFTKIEVKDGHILGFQNINPLKNYEYYQGAGWNKWGFPTFEDWKKYVKKYLSKIKNPLIVTIK